MTVSRWCIAGAVVIAAMVSGCDSYMPRVERVWESGRAALNSGMEQEKLLSCAGRPFKVEEETGQTRWFYGATIFHGATPFGAAYSWCIASIGIRDGRTTGVNVRSANPGGLTDGSAACGLVVDACVSDGSLFADAPRANHQVGQITGEDTISALERYSQERSQGQLLALLGVLDMTANAVAQRRASGASAQTASARIPATPGSIDRSNWAATTSSNYANSTPTCVSRSIRPDGDEVLRNTCGYEITLVYCGIGPTGNSSLDCSRERKATRGLMPGAIVTVGDKNGRYSSVHWLDCPGGKTPSRTNWTGNSIAGDCPQ